MPCYIFDRFIDASKDSLECILNEVPFDCGLLVCKSNYRIHLIVHFFDRHYGGMEGSTRFPLNRSSVPGEPSC